MRWVAIIIPLLGGCLLDFDPDRIDDAGPTGCLDAAPADATLLAQKASELGPREWKETSRTVRLLGGQVPRFIAYDEQDNSWRNDRPRRGSTMPTASPATVQQSAYHVRSTPIDTHCVLGYFGYDYDQSSVWLYRHD